MLTYSIVANNIKKTSIISHIIITKKQQKISQQQTISHMGSLTHPTIFQTPIFSLSQFTQIQPNSYTRRSTYGTYTCLQHKLTQQQIDRYFIQFANKKQQQNYYECYLQRFRQEYIVSTIEYIDKTQKQFCSNLYTCEVYIEHIPVRLGDITDIPYPDNLYILKNSLYGFNLLYDMIGYFQVQEDHICINNYGEVKVWLNSDLSKNYPQDCNQQSRSQCDMRNTSIQQCPVDVSEYFRKKNNRYPKLLQAIALLGQYVVEYKVVMPKYCQSIFQLFKDSEKDRTLPLSQLENQVEAEENRGSIHLSDPIVPMLPINGQGIAQQNVQNDLKNSSAAHTQKFEASLMEEGAKIIMQNQNTQRKNYDTAFNQNFNNHTPHKILIQNYNKLSTKRTPVSQKTIKYIDQFALLTIKKKPIVHFTYISPNQPINANSNNLVRPRNNSHSSINFTFSNVGGQGNFGPPIVRFMKKQQNYQNGYQSGKQNQLSSQQEKKSVETENNKNMSNIRDTISFPAYIKQSDIYQICSSVTTENKFINTQTKEQNKHINKFIDDKKVALCYYDTGSGSEQIDPQIAADLIKYL